jgi:phosphoenolpyruvate carboxylase
VKPTEALLALAQAANDANPHRQDEPYRQALIGVYARVAATATRKSGLAPTRAPHVTLEPYATPASSRPTSRRSRIR